MNNEFYSRGKLLITGEYFVLEGSLAFALPLRLGQNMSIHYQEDSEGEVIWESRIKGSSWFRGIFDIKTMSIKEASDWEKASFIQKLLIQIKQLSDVLNDNSKSLKVRANVEFPMNWGLGSSSSLISNLAYWGNINPYDLLFKTMEGSGYDVACARSKNPIFYQLKDKPVVQEIEFKKDFLNHIYFIYSGRKQNSLRSVQKYRDRIKNLKKDRDLISEITQKIIQSSSLLEFEEYINEHESIVAKAINRTTIKSAYYSDFRGTVKSLGAWGGDFIMAIHSESDYLKRYFTNKGLSIIFPYKDLVYEG